MSKKKVIRVFTNKEGAENLKAAAEWLRRKERELMFSKKNLNDDKENI